MPPPFWHQVKGGYYGINGISMFKFPPSVLTENQFTGYVTIIPLKNQYVLKNSFSLYQNGRFIPTEGDKLSNRPLSDIIGTLYRQGFTRVETALQYFIYNQRTSCVQRIPNYADNQVLTTFQADTDQLKRFSQQTLKVPGSWRVLLGYLTFVVEPLKGEENLPDDEDIDPDEEDNSLRYKANTESIVRIEDDLLESIAYQLSHFQ